MLFHLPYKVASHFLPKVRYSSRHSERQVKYALRDAQNINLCEILQDLNLLVIKKKILSVQLTIACHTHPGIIRLP